ncbi:hypothetical protein C5167_017854 [Papaver somniferum]|uniref:Uncharacterized protein n=1 Tax=Papaver somniferum TaxID=3469 RepID=A0A4Y7IL47_PAPSO|nr:hypothetical protein C5167_017854 [Papaver somniferum]
MMIDGSHISADPTKSPAQIFRSSFPFLKLREKPEELIQLRKHSPDEKFKSLKSVSVRAREYEKEKKTSRGMKTIKHHRKRTT